MYTGNTFLIGDINDPSSAGVIFEVF